MAGAIRLDYTALGNAARRLETVQGFLSEGKVCSTIHLSTDSAGSRDIVDALNDFQGKWSDARKAMAETVKAAKEFMDGTCKAFNEVEDQMVTSLDG